MFHSVIIPHRNRNRAMEQTLWSIRRSAAVCSVTDYEVVVVDAISSKPPKLGRREQLVANRIHSKVFNKSLCLNIGIEQSRGDVLTFLDADMLVGEYWMWGVLLHLTVPDPPIRLCYRARHLIVTDQEQENQGIVLNILEKAVDKAGVLRSWFDDYDEYTKCFEAYGDPDTGNKPKATEPVFGNSQYSIRRDVLGDLRFNDEMVGAGFEDLWMIRQIWDKYGADYKGAILTDPRYALLHMRHPRPQMPGGDWSTKRHNDANKAMYKRRWPQTMW